MVKSVRKEPAVPSVEKVVYQRVRVPRAVPKKDPAAFDLVGDCPVNTPPGTIDCAEVNHDWHRTIPEEVVLERRPEILPTP